MSAFFYRNSWWWASARLGPFRFAYSLRELNRRYVEVGVWRLLLRMDVRRVEWGREWSTTAIWFRKEAP